jgi:hypothetical protein
VSEVFRYRVGYRTAGTQNDFLTFISEANGVTDGEGIIESTFKGGAVTVTGLTLGNPYEFRVERVGDDGLPIGSTSSNTVQATPSPPKDGALSGDDVAYSDSDVGVSLEVRDGQRGVFILFSNASWKTTQLYFAPRAAYGFPGSPSTSFTKAPSNISTGPPATSAVAIDNVRLFVGFDYREWQVRIEATLQNSKVTVTLRFPD